MELKSFMQRKLPAATVAREATDDEKIADVLKKFLVPFTPLPRPSWALSLRMMREVDMRPVYYGMDLDVSSDDEASDD